MGATYIDSYTGDNSIPVFISFIIEEYKNHKKISGEEAYFILDKAGVLDHFARFYDILHTQSRQWLVEEADNMVSKSKQQ